MSDTQEGNVLIDHLLQRGFRTGLIPKNTGKRNRTTNTKTNTHVKE